MQQFACGSRAAIGLLRQSSTSGAAVGERRGEAPRPCPHFHNARGLRPRPHVLNARGLGRAGRCRAQQHSGRPTSGGPRGVEVRRPGEGAWPARRSRPPRPGAGGRLCPPGCRAMYRREADVRAGADRATAARGWLTGEPSAVRVCGGGGGRRRGAFPDRPGSRVGDLHGAERCLAQRRELECRSHGTAHQLAERALGRATCRQLGEHVFAKLGVGSDGTNASDSDEVHAFRSPERKIRSETATGLARATRDRGRLWRCTHPPDAGPRGGRRGRAFAGCRQGALRRSPRPRLRRLPPGCPSPAATPAPSSAAAGAPSSAASARLHRPPRQRRQRPPPGRLHRPPRNHRRTARTPADLSLRRAEVASAT